MTETLGTALPKEMTRVRDVVTPAYIEIGPAGAIAFAMMRHTRRGETDQPPRVLFADFRRAACAIAGEQTND